MTLSEKASAATLLTVLGVLFFAWREDQKPAIPDSTRLLADSLRTTAPAFDSVVSAQFEEAERQNAIARRLAHQERALKALRDSLGRRADSLALDAGQAVDSARAWRVAYEARTEEVVTERARGDTLDAQVRALTIARDSATARADATALRLDAVERVNAGLTASITKLTTCKVDLVLASIPCISRRSAFVAGVATAGGAVLMLRR